jgi:flagellar biosynthesis protein FlhB
MKDAVSGSSLLQSMVAWYFTPMILFLFNYVFIPTLVDTVSYYEEYETKSDRHKANLFRYFFFIIINTVFLPISGLTTISAFLNYVTTN